MKKRSVGLAILTDIPEMGGFVAIAQVRGEFNHEKMAPESNPGLCQLTVHGKCKNEEESLIDALLREVKEELGEKVKDRLLYGTRLEELNRVETGEKVIANYGMVLLRDFLEDVQLTASSAGFRMVTQEELKKIMVFEDLGPLARDVGLRDRRYKVMYRDEIEALKIAFEKFCVLPLSNQ